ncbi:MAG: carbohydrate porin [Acetobacteraceae bacterium]|nr:carbohydrate porin [Acetobacteraceae bacterium]
MRLRTAAVRALLCLGSAMPGRLHAQAPDAPAEQQGPVPGQTGAPAVPTGPSPGEPGFATQLFASSRSNLLGDIYGLRSFLGNYGISLGLTNSIELFGNVSGGIRRGASGNGLTQFGLGIDTQQAFGWEGGTFNVSGFWIYGGNFSSRFLGTLQTNSGILASPTVRLWEIWYQQVLADGRLDLKIGQQSLDQEFMTSQGSSLFINTMMGWPLVPSDDLYAGGPAYPLSSLGLRLRAQPTGSITALAGVFQDNPPGGPFYEDGQRRGASRAGINFNLRTGALFIAEVQYALNQPSEGLLESAPTARSLPGTYKLGAWFDTANFPDQRFDDTGLSLADPNSTGNPRLHRHNFSVYAVADQTIWRPDGDGPQAVSVFARPMFAPTDQNLIDFSINAGVTLKAPLPDRDNDTFGIGFGVGNVSRRASDRDRDTAFFTGAYTPVRGAETFVEITYQYQIAPWWQVQPDFQYFWMPGGGVANTADPSRRIGNAAIFGVRTNVTF